MSDKILVVEISGKRPGDKNKRPTEKMNIKYDHLIISNNSEGYDTDWEIVNVPQDYVEWYKANLKNSDNAWYAPMNRTYAIKYAKEHGYRYVIQLDDNIVTLRICYSLRERYAKYDLKKDYDVAFTGENNSPLINDFIDILVEMLKQSNAGVAGCAMSGAGMPGEDYLRERYCYSLFAIDVERSPQYFHGDFEDDIEFRMKCQQMNVPMLQNAILRYGKTAQQINKDLTGCRAEYLKAGLKRGEHMAKLYGSTYSAGMSSRSNKAGKQNLDENSYFRHKIKSLKLGTLIKDKEKIDEKMRALFKKYAKSKENVFKVEEKKI